MLSKKKEDYIYLAAILDGEGYFGIKKNTPRSHGTFEIRIVVSNTDKKLIYWLHQTFGGHIIMLIPKNERHSTRYDWEISSKSAGKLLNFVFPYLKVKHKQAGLLLKLQSTMGVPKGQGLKVPKNILIQRENLYGEVKAINSEVKR